MVTIGTDYLSTSIAHSSHSRFRIMVRAELSGPAGASIGLHNTYVQTLGGIRAAITGAIWNNTEPYQSVQEVRDGVSNRHRPMPRSISDRRSGTDPSRVMDPSRRLPGDSYCVGVRPEAR